MPTAGGRGHTSFLHPSPRHGPQYLEASDEGGRVLADWEVIDRVSGRTGALDDYTAWGGSLGISYRF